MKIVLTFGCWDLLHVGHLNALEQARAMGSLLVVGVASDVAIEKDKGERPAIPLADRCRMLRALRVVNVVLPYSTLDFLPTLEKVRPAILAVGGDWGSQPRHRAAEEWVRVNGRELRRLARYPAESTTAIRQRVLVASRPCESATH